jgi:5'-nucleotidase (lipoprotein e(P4) family)
MIRILFCVLFSSFIISKDLPNDVRWVTSSKEYKFSCHQTFNTASIMLDKYLKKNNNKNLAIVMDLDETVLDNSQYQVELNNENETFNMESWSAWVLREEAKLVPGVKKFIKKVRKNNIRLIFISNRMHARLKATKANMKKLGIFSKDDIFLLRKDKKDKKDVRRNEIYSTKGRMKKYEKFNVIQYFGDAMGDFPVLDHSEFGKSQFVLPNPMYGKW